VAVRKNSMNLFNNFNIQTFKNKKPPADNSMSTFKEINEINKMPVNEKFVKYNDDQEKVFKDIFKKNNLKFPDQLFKQLNNDSNPVIKKLKNYHNRTRPNGLANGFGMSVDVVDMDTAKTKSYPSGHSAQSRLFAKVFSDIYPKYKRDFMQAADNISKSRLIGRVHYPSDSQNGVELGDALYQHYKNQNNESI
tara:strand:+ start:1816 stop:2394 length:579 start_codon:yes stop_codon:yes gene_type:complete